jgi:ribosomal protein S18 acetylase RimI-like enzyme
MAKPGDIRVQWFSLTNRGMAPAGLDGDGNVPRAALENGHAIIAALQHGSPLVLSGAVFQQQKLSLTIPDNALEAQFASGRIADDPWRLIIRAARDCATRLSCRHMEVLLPDEPSPGLDALCRSLLRAGLQQTARFAIWSLTSRRKKPVASAAGYGLEILSAEHINRDFRLRQLFIDLLGPILADSQDLLQISTPDPAALLEEWDVSDGTLIFETDSSENLISVCCCIGGEDDGDGLPRSTEIRFLGVLPQHRRKGSARRLISAAVRHANLTPVGKSSDMPPELTVCVDEENKPAISLYEKAGFSRDRPMQLWIDPKLAGSSGGSFSDEG